jgi:hypothetical protein
MTENLIEARKVDAVRTQYVLTGFTQAAGIRTYAFESRVDARWIACTVAVDLALIPGYGIRIQDLPLLCRELLQHQAKPEEIGPFFFTEQEMRSHAEKLAIVKEKSEHRKKQSKPLTDWSARDRFAAPIAKVDIG